MAMALKPKPTAVPATVPSTNSSSRSCIRKPMGCECACVCVVYGRARVSEPPKPCTPSQKKTVKTTQTLYSITFIPWLVMQIKFSIQ